MAEALALLRRAGLPERLIIDASHDNSLKDPSRQPKVVEDVARQIANGEERIFGIMVESHLKPGRQDLVPGKPLQYGVSITDASGALGKYRYLLFDCIETETDDPWGNTFYSEIDVVAKK